MHLFFVLKYLLRSYLDDPQVSEEKGKSPFFWTVVIDRCVTQGLLPHLLSCDCWVKQRLSLSGILKHGTGLSLAFAFLIIKYRERGYAGRCMPLSKTEIADARPPILVRSSYGPSWAFKMQRKAQEVEFRFYSGEVGVLCEPCTDAATYEGTDGWLRCSRPVVCLPAKRESCRGAAVFRLLAPERGEIGLGAFPYVILDVGIYRQPGRG